MNNKLTSNAYFNMIILFSSIFIFSSCGFNKVNNKENIITIETTVDNTTTTSFQGNRQDNSITNTINPETTNKLITCEIKGEVVNPGVYELDENSRVNDLINLSGGLSNLASVKFINRASLLNDGEVIYIPSKYISKEEYLNIIGNYNIALEETTINKKVETNKQNNPNKNINTNANNANNANKGNNANTNNKNLININIADKSELEKIPGVGPVTADNIIKYREENGLFKSIEDIKKVNRIGDKTFLKMKESICVN